MPHERQPEHRKGLGALNHIQWITFEVKLTASMQRCQDLLCRAQASNHKSPVPGVNSHVVCSFSHRVVGQSLTSASTINSAQMSSCRGPCCPVFLQCLCSCWCHCAACYGTAVLPRAQASAGPACGQPRNTRAIMRVPRRGATVQHTVRKHEKS
jgi:hypothetical protein